MGEYQKVQGKVCDKELRIRNTDTKIGKTSTLSEYKVILNIYTSNNTKKQQLKKKLQEMEEEKAEIQKYQEPLTYH